MNSPAKTEAAGIAAPISEGPASAGSPAPNRHPFRKSLRNPNINYRNGWFFVTTQAAYNKCVFGAIVGDKCVLNVLGEAVRDCWLSLPAKYPEVELDEFVVMPNHFHAILRIHYHPTNREHHLGFIMSRFKGATGHTYGVMRAEGRIPGICAPVSERGASAPSPHLWQFDYWDDLITSAEELENQRRYIRNNPANWTRDRYGPCTSYSFGNLALLDAPMIAFVASQGFAAATLAPRRFRGASRSAKADALDIGAGGFSRQEAAIISTFTSAQEREALRRALAKGRRVVQVCPSGVPAEAGAEAPLPDIGAAGSISERPASAGPPPQLFAACRENRALIISPQPPGSRLNKKVATWCNEYVLRHASEIWVGDISPGGLLDTLLHHATKGSF